MFTVGITPTAEDVKASLDGHMLVVGQTNSGKTTALRSMLLSACRAYGDSLAVVVLDPKRVGFLEWKRRADVFTRPEQFVPVLTLVRQEIDRRYQRMVEFDAAELAETRSMPRLLLVIDELPAFLHSAPTEKARKELVKLLGDIVQMGRQCNVTVMLGSQTIGSDVVPTALRSGLSQRLVFKLMGQEQLEMATAGRSEEAPADFLFLQGEMYALTSETVGSYVRCRARNADADAMKVALAQLAPDKPALPWLDELTR